MVTNSLSTNRKVVVISEPLSDNLEIHERFNLHTLHNTVITIITHSWPSSTRQISVTLGLAVQGRSFTSTTAFFSDLLTIDCDTPNSSANSFCFQPGVPKESKCHFCPSVSCMLKAQHEHQLKPYVFKGTRLSFFFQ